MLPESVPPQLDPGRGGALRKHLSTCPWAQRLHSSSSFCLGVSTPLSALRLGHTASLVQATVGFPRTFADTSSLSSFSPEVLKLLV